MGHLTIRDIARLSGCGIATVSRVLNHLPGVSEQKRRRVLAVVEEQGFQPNNNAKHLKLQGGMGVAMVVKGTQNMLLGAIAERMQTQLRDCGWEAAVYYLDEESDEVAYALGLCRERKPLGILFLGGEPSCFQKGFLDVQVPCVLVTNRAQELAFSNLSSVTTDDEAAAAQVIGYLAQKGHWQIGLLGGNPAHSQVSARRVQGCRRAMEELGLPFEEELQWECCRYAVADAYEAAGRLLDRCPQITALFAMSDVIALGALRALADRGLEVPRDLSVVGYDGIPLAGYSIPRLTTVAQDVERLAGEGVELLLEAMSHPEREAVHRVVPFHLVEGESVAPPKHHPRKEEDRA